MIATATRGGDSAVYGAFFGTPYQQWDDTLGPWPFGTAGFEAWVRGRGTGEVTQVTLTTPLGENETMAPLMDGAFIGVTLPSASLRNMVFPPGTYKIVEQLAEGGDQTHSLTLADAAAPPAVKVLNTTGWDAWPTRKPLPVAWAPGPGTLPTDTFVVEVQDLNGVVKLFQAPGPGQPGALTSTTTTLTIPGDHLTNAGPFYVRVACYRAQGALPQLTGQFSATMAALTLVEDAASPVNHYQFLRGRVYCQTNDQAPVLVSTNAYKVEAYLAENNLAQIVDVTVQAPNRAAITLGHQPDAFDWSYAATFNSEAELMSAWPAGSYQWSVTQAMGASQSGALPVGLLDGVLPLRVLNAEQLRTNTFDGDIELTWLRTGPTSAVDRIEVLVTTLAGQVVMRDPDSRFLPPLPSNATTWTINGHDLPANEELIAVLRYVRVTQHGSMTFNGAEDISGSFAETQVHIGRSAPPPLAQLQVFTTTVPPACVAEYYGAQLAAMGGTLPYAWTLAGGSLPQGLSLAADGFIQGVPTGPGDFSLTAKVTDASNNTAQATVSLVVTGSIPELYVATTNLAVARGSWPYVAELSSRGGLPPVEWEVVSGQLPPGLVLMKDQGILTGTPSQAGNFEFTVRLTDAAGTSKERTLSLSVTAPDEPPLAISKFEVTGPTTLALALNASPGDPVSIEHSADCVHWTTLLPADYPAVGRLEVAPPNGLTGFYRARWGQAPPPPNPPEPVTAEPDTNLVALATFSPTNDLSLALTNASGHVYRLDIPSNALPYEVDIQMSYVPALGNSPFPDGYHGGVELRPGGLRFQQPATLTVTFPQGVPPGYTPLAWDSGGWNPHLCIARTFSNSVVIPVMHFSGQGGGNASSGQTDNFANQNQACPKYAGEQLVAAAIKASAAKHGGGTFDPIDLIPAFKEWFDWSVWPGLKAGQSDIDVFEYAVREYLTWLRAYQLCTMDVAAEALANTPPEYLNAEKQILLSLQRAINDKVPKTLARGYANAIVRTHVRAVSEMDAWIAYDMLGYLRSATLLGVDGLLPDYLSIDAVFNRLARIWRFEVRVQSIIDTVGNEGQFVEQVRSGRCPIEMDPSTTEGTFGHLQRGANTNILMVSWAHLRGDGRRVRPVPKEGQLRTYYLKVTPVYKEKTGDTSSQSNCTPPAPDYPVDAKINLVFYVTDPVTTEEIQSVDGTWYPEPVLATWEAQLRLAHSMNVPEFPFIPNAQWPNFPAPADIFIAGSQVWKYSGGTLFGDAPWTRDIVNDSGKLTERTILELYFAPKPLRDSDTNLPPPQGTSTAGKRK